MPILYILDLAFFYICFINNYLIPVILNITSNIYLHKTNILIRYYNKAFLNFFVKELFRYFTNHL